MVLGRYLSYQQYFIGRVFMKNQRLKSIIPTIFYLNAVIWLLLGLSSFGRISEGRVTPIYIQAVIAILMFGNAAAMLLSGWGIHRGGRGYFYLAMAVIPINILLTFTDQVGLLDWITLAIDLVLLFLLIIFRKAYVYDKKTVRIGSRAEKH